jgi:hypothetical protein
MDKKQLTELESEAIKDAGRFAVVFGISFTVLAEPALSAGNLPDSKALIVSAAIAGASQAITKTKPMWQKLFQDAIAAVQAQFNKAAAPDPAAPAPAPATK